MGRTEQSIFEQFSYWRAAIDSVAPPQEAEIMVFVGCGTSYNLALSLAALANARGRAAIYLAELPGRWPASFLDHQPPPELLAELRSIYLEAGPNLEFTNMAPRPFDLGPVSDVAGETWRTFAKWPILRTLTVWCLFALLLGTAFYLTRL